MRAIRPVHLILLDLSILTTGSLPESNESSQHFHIILILSSHLRLCLLSGLFPLSLPSEED
jgi:hypothetical protein